MSNLARTLAGVAAEARPDSISAEVRRDADAFRKLRQLMGHVENSSEQVVTLSQDDATRTYVLGLRGYAAHAEGQRSRNYYGDSLHAAIQAAIDAGEGAD